MAEHNLLGRQGEEAAARFLVTKGYHIVERDWQFNHKDIDIIAEKQGTLVFVEVKTRSSEDFGEPQDAVDDNKINNLLTAANTYVNLHHIDMDLRFDIIAVIKENTTYKIKHYLDCFTAADWKPKHTQYPNW